MIDFLLCWAGLAFLLIIPVGRFCGTNDFRAEEEAANLIQLEVLP